MPMSISERGQSRAELPPRAGQRWLESGRGLGCGKGARRRLDATIRAFPPLDGSRLVCVAVPRCSKSLSRGGSFPVVNNHRGR